MIKKVSGINIKVKQKLLAREKRILPVVIGNKVKNHFKLGFRKGGGQTDDSRGGWKPRKVNTGRRRAILVKSGNLRADLRRRETSFNRTVVGTRAVDYSSYHNEGTRKLPKREHIGDSREMNRAIEKLIEKKLDNIFK